VGEATQCARTAEAALSNSPEDFRTAADALKFRGVNKMTFAVVASI